MKPDATSVLRVALLLLPHVTELGRSVFFRFWRDNDLGPMPPDLDAWDAIDAKADERLRSPER